MLTANPGFQLAPNLTARLSWSMQTIAFVHKWQQQARTLPADEALQHQAEAATVVLDAVAQLDDRLVETLSDLYRATGHLPAPGDRLLVGPLQLCVEDRHWELTYPGGQEQATLIYCFDIERYRYEPFRSASAPNAHPTSMVEQV